ncbi:Coiled-coil domain-containing protein 124-like protein, partial [Smittium mucronatum]
TAAKQKKALVQQEKDSKKAQVHERKLAEEWAVGSNEAKQLKKEQEFAKKQEKLARKKEADDLLRAEEAAIAKLAKKQPAAASKLFPGAKKPAAAAAAAPSTKPTTGVGKPVSLLNGSAPAFVPRSLAATAVVSPEPEPVETLSASGLDDALHVFDTISLEESLASSHAVSIDKSSGFSGLVDRHPERRHKAALKAFEERELPRLKEENKGLRLQQLKQLLWKEWQKSPENPFNQSLVAHNATQDEIKSVVKDHIQSSKSLN